ncbi:AraC family transcriptional regulator [Burkholderia territorii]|uniref:AraC family transcriptional regulator n=1 Tax=Burkholderia territorii TaxID=1503055 RepID=A0A105VPZ5_9BURK|nr:AraC family transcriptional regulator [Burkholderia territorii]KVV51809.1 AraC family transcriptional regulator [Burkholderia territorii]KVX42817.1 AraC family transcriptional regulator [Burkholderia territorii]
MFYSAICLRDSTIMSDDPFSDILRLTNAETLATGGFCAGGAWAVRFPAPDKIKFFAVVKGTCWVSIDGEETPIRFGSGDVGLLTAKRSFVLASNPCVPAVDAMALFSGAGKSTVELGHGNDFAQIGGHVLLDPATGSLLSGVLPPWIHVPAASPQAAKVRWLLEQLVEEREADLPGAQLVSAQLSQLLFIQILRAHLNTSAPLTGWLRALGNPRIAPALRLMHGDPARSWRLDELAAACAMSRTTFASHFRSSTGVAPLAYLGEWRMRLAGRRLRDENIPVAVLAQSLGYSSESAFSNAFKRMSGHSPTAYRQIARLASTDV